MLTVRCASLSVPVLEVLFASCPPGHVLVFSPSRAVFSVPRCVGVLLFCFRSPYAHASSTVRRTRPWRCRREWVSFPYQYRGE